MAVESTSILFYVNGQRRQADGNACLQTLLSYLRYTEKLTGAKLGCGEGGCGACTVLFSTFDNATRRVCHRAVNACLFPLAAVDGGAVTTIEAVGDRRGGLAPVQQALVNMHGSQCGFCTPGIVMSMYALLRDNAANRPESQPLSEQDVETNFDGNLCRCTGYRPILDAFKGLVNHNNDACQPSCVLGEACCKVSGNSGCSNGELQENGVDIGDRQQINGVEDQNFDKEFIFPPELIRYDHPALKLAHGRWFRPKTLERFKEIKAAYTAARVIVGNTELGIEAKFKGLEVETFLCATHVPEMNSIVTSADGVNIGSSVTWTQLNEFVSNLNSLAKANSPKRIEEHKYGSLRAIQSQLRWFAGKQIRNVAAIGGNIVTASPISDVNPVWIAAKADFMILDCRTGDERSVAAKEFFLSYRRVDLKPEEVLLNVRIPWNQDPCDLTFAFKTARRKDDDIAIVSAGIRIFLESKSDRDTQKDNYSTHRDAYFISDIILAYGGIAPKTVSLGDAESFARGLPFSEKSLHSLLGKLAVETLLPKDVPGGMPEFRQSLALGFVFKAFLQAASHLKEHCAMNGTRYVPFSDKETNLMKEIQIPREEYRVSRGVQVCTDRGPQTAMDSTGTSVKHLSSLLQVSGEAKYLDDMKPIDGELQAAFVMSSESHARIIAVETEEASQMPGVCRVVTAKDVRGVNSIGPLVQDELCFAEDVVTTVGQVIGIVVAKTTEQALKAVRAVKITYEKLPAILTIEEAIQAKSFAKGVPERIIQKGNVSEVFAVAERDGHTVNGSVRIGAQEHWYLEPHGTIAIPDENGEMVILASTQAAAMTQDVVAKVLGVPMHKVTCKVKRIGGGFGGKETRSLFISAAVAVAAQAVQRPVRLILDRDTDMLITGTRHAFLAHYKAAFKANGRITALQLEIFHNMGNSTDLSIPVMERALYHANNCYDIPQVRFVGKACFTHTASSTAFRGFGAPQSMMIAENVVEHVAWVCKMPVVRVRDTNIFGKNGNSSTTPFGMKFNSDPLLLCWDAALVESRFKERRKMVDAFNESHQLRKRGISALPTMFGISFSFRALNQAGALVHIYHGDGSVLISHGGVEMGQGLHTKMCQVAATELQLPLEMIFISETATDKVPNASPTAASYSSDLYGMAVRNACQELNRNLAPCKAALGDTASWLNVVSHAWLNRISLFATGFYKTPEIDDLDLAKPGSTGSPFFYYTNGAAVSEVEIDVLTGESKNLRTDIVMDVGRPLNPALDVGQIEGAFVQGLGWCTMEEVVKGSTGAHAWLRPGQTLTLGPSTYKIPGFSDTPEDFRVKVLETRNEKDTIHSSKGIGEPPLFLAASVFFAIRDAIRSSRLQYGRDEWFQLDSPASVERIRLAFCDDLLRRVVPDEEGVRPKLTL
ncbi:unnamed protein product [Chondrus crispus]|uniref:Xanthine dehydrogenase n=1 Tax=Chondrus crispus TaxID=2769 RepID=R7QL28_CHOCR|nr:unnamed protein product [Chondrus crispus]CDF38784.1 unnamed protein product [Chondrus crispus]|eukprot:XP_005718689.1 unnamed protein product [Chondrus crispus]